MNLYTKSELLFDVNQTLRTTECVTLYCIWIQDMFSIKDKPPKPSAQHLPQTVIALSSNLEGRRPISFCCRRFKFEGGAEPNGNGECESVFVRGGLCNQVNNLSIIWLMTLTIKNLRFAPGYSCSMTPKADVLNPC